MFAFSCQANIFSILEEQIDQRRETDFRVVNIAVAIETIIYCVSGDAHRDRDVHGLEVRNLTQLLCRSPRCHLVRSALYAQVIGTSGYLLFGADVDGNVLRNLDMRQPLHVTAQLCVGVSLCLSYPVRQRRGATTAVAVAA